MELIDAFLVECGIGVDTNQPFELVNAVTFGKLAEPGEKIVANGGSGVFVALLVFVKQRPDQDKTIALSEIALLNNAAIWNAVVRARRGVNAIDSAIPRLISVVWLVLVQLLEQGEYDWKRTRPGRTSLHLA